MERPKAMRFRLQDASWVKTPEFGGGESVLYRSRDQHVAVVAFRESGKHSFTYPFDEFALILKGSAKVAVRGGETFTISAGEVLYVEEGTHIDFEMSPDFEDITVLLAKHPVAWR